MSIKEKAQEQFNGFERLLHKIPGFKGYYDRELRRDADKLQREYMAQQLHDVKGRLDEAVRAISRRGDFDLLNECGDLQKQIEKLVGEIRYADRGYSGFFDLVKIKEAELDAVYDFDAALLDAVLVFVQGFDPAACDAAVVRTWQDRVREISERFHKRRDLLNGFSQGV